METKVFEDEFKGHKLFTVWEIDENGEKKGKYPKVSIGKGKSNALVAHLDEFIAWVEAQGE